MKFEGSALIGPFPRILALKIEEHQKFYYDSLVNYCIF